MSFMRKRYPQTEEFFWRLIDIDTPDKCWLWKGGTIKGEYGEFPTWAGRSARKVAFEFFYKRKPLKTLEATCLNRFCCNPHHILDSGKKGAPSWNKGKGIPAEQRFWNFVDQSGGPESCWIYQGHISKDGYGSFTPSTIPERAHRFAFQLYYGPLKKGEQVLHNCPTGDNKLCVNPWHLWKGSHVDNMEDGKRKKQFHMGAGHHGAKLTESDVMLILWILRDSSFTLKDIAAKFNITTNTVWRIKQKKGWRHVSI